MLQKSYRQKSQIQFHIKSCASAVSYVTDSTVNVSKKIKWHAAQGHPFSAQQTMHHTMADGAQFDCVL